MSSKYLVVLEKDGDQFFSSPMEDVEKAIEKCDDANRHMTWREKKRYGLHEVREYSGDDYDVVYPVRFEIVDGSGRTVFQSGDYSEIEKERGNYEADFGKSAEVRAYTSSGSYREVSYLW